MGQKPYISLALFRSEGVEQLLRVGVLVLIASSAVVGARLVWLAVSTREIPELAHGAAFLLLGVVGYPLSIIARQGLTGSPDTVGMVLASALAAQDLASLAMLVGTGHTFRRGSGWLPGLTVIVAVLFAVSLVGHGLTVGSGALSAGFLVFLWGRLTSENVGQDPMVLALTSVVGLVAGAASWLAFVPPTFHVRRLAAREPAS